MAALGTPDGLPDCNVVLSPDDIDPTGSHPKCVSEVGAFDMVGNLAEWVAEWVPRATTCGGALFPPEFTGENCFHGADTAFGPAPLVRGTDGVFAVNAVRTSPGGGETTLGFRGAR